jgi:hypothetical protein
VANTFQIVISATDKATDTVRKVNKAIGSLTQPFKNVGTSFKSLGRELGFEKIGKNLSSIGQSAERAAKGVGSIVAPLAAITGVASVAGIIAMADNWAKLSRNVTYSAQSIGVSTTKLQEFQGAAKLAGLSSEAMTQSLQSLGDTMEDALYGRNQQALMLFNRLGVGIKRTKDGAMDAAGEFRALAAAIYNIKSPQAQNLAAGQLGLTALLPLIRQGPAAFDQLISRARELGLVMSDGDIKSANEFAANLSALQASGEGLKNSIGNALIPAIKPLIDQLTAWISKNRDLIASRIGEWARDFGKWLQSIDWNKVGQGITNLVNGIADLVDHLGGWKAAAIEVGVVMNAGLIANVISLGYNLTKLGLGIGGIIVKFGQMGSAAKAATVASEAAAATTAEASAAGSAAGAAGTAAAGGGLLARLLGGATIGALLKTAMWVPRPDDDPAAMKGYIERLNPNHESTWQQWSNIFHGRERFGAQGHAQNTKVKPPSAAQVASVIKSFEGMGWSHAQAAGLAANLATESGFDPKAVGDNGAAYGIGQWHQNRQFNFAKWSGHDIGQSSLDEQLRFVNYELTQGDEQKAGAALRTATDAQQAGAIVSADYERPADQTGEAARRAGLAGAYAKAPSGPYTAPTTPTADTSASGATAGAGSNSDISVTVTFDNAPDGLKAKVTSSGPARTTSRIVYSSVGQS